MQIAGTFSPFWLDCEAYASPQVHCISSTLSTPQEYTAHSVSCCIKVERSRQAVRLLAIKSAGAVTFYAQPLRIQVLSSLARACRCICFWPTQTELLDMMLSGGLMVHHRVMTLIVESPTPIPPFLFSQLRQEPNHTLHFCLLKNKLELRLW